MLWIIGMGVGNGLGANELVTNSANTSGRNTITLATSATVPSGATTTQHLDGSAVSIGNCKYKSALSWDFYIGGYQPAQKWLKDRKGKALSFDDISHYQKIVVALCETHRLMEEIDRILF